MNWRQLKEFCNSLDESKLDNNVVLWREEEGISRMEPSILEEDHYISIGSGEMGCFPLREAGSEPIEELKKVYDKGDPILYEEV